MIDKKIFGTLFFSIFSAVTGVGIVVPLLPVYAQSLGASGLYIGLIFGSFALSRTIFLPYFGRLSDRKGRKRLILVGLISYALISIAFILAKNVQLLVAIRFIQGIASSMMMPAIQAYVGDITPRGREGFSMGVFISGIIHMPMGYIADRMNRRVLIVTGGLIVGGGMVYFAQAGSLTDLIVASVVFGLGGGISMPAHMAISVFKGGQTEAMGSLMGLMTMAHSLGMLLGSIKAWMCSTAHRCLTSSPLH